MSKEKVKDLIFAAQCAISEYNIAICLMMQTKYFVKHLKS